MPLPTYLMSNFPSVRPSLNLQFDSQPTPEDMTSHLASVGATFSRASIGTYTDANGIIQEATAGQARPNYSSAGVHEGLLIEESRTNLYELGQTPYLGISDVATLRQGGAYGSAYFVDVIVDNGVTIDDGTGQGFDFQSSATTGDHTFSFIVKGGNGIDNIRVRRSTIGVDTVQVLTLDLTDGTLGTDTLGATVRDLGNNTYYVAFTDNANASANVAAYWIKPDVGETCDGVNFFSLAGLQAEAGSFPTSYIPTIPTFTSRASDGTYFDSNGVLQTASTDEERIDHKYIDGQWVEAGLLLEGASENLVLQSEDFGTTWINSNASISVDATHATAPDGTTTANELDDGSADERKGLLQDVTTTASEPYTLSVFLKAETLPAFRIALSNTSDATDWTAVQIDLSDNSLGTEDGNGSNWGSTSSKVEIYGDWLRLSITSEHPTTTSIRAVLCTSDGTSIAPTNSHGRLDYAGNNQTVLAWGAQLEEGSQPTSYIATTTASATRSADVYTTATKQRSADVCYIDGTAFTDFYNQEEGTIYMDFETNVVFGESISNWNLDFNDTTSDNRIVHRARFNQVIIEKNDVIQYTINLADLQQNTRYKLAFAVKDGFQELVIDGSVSSSETNSIDMPTLTQVELEGASARRKFIYFPRALTQAELIKLTQ